MALSKTVRKDEIDDPVCNLVHQLNAAEAAYAHAVKARSVAQEHLDQARRNLNTLQEQLDAAMAERHQRASPASMWARA